MARFSIAPAALALIAAVLAGCAGTAGHAPAPQAAATWSKPGASSAQVEQALQSCGYVDRFAIGQKAIGEQFACMADQGYVFNQPPVLLKEHCQGANMPAGCAVYWHTLNRP